MQPTARQMLTTQLPSARPCPPAFLPPATSSRGPQHLPCLVPRRTSCRLGLLWPSPRGQPARRSRPPPVCHAARASETSASRADCARRAGLAEPSRHPPSPHTPPHTRIAVRAANPDPHHRPHTPPPALPPPEPTPAAAAAARARQAGPGTVLPRAGPTRPGIAGSGRARSVGPADSARPVEGTPKRAGASGRATGGPELGAGGAGSLPGGGGGRGR